MRITKRQLRRIIREQIDNMRQGELDLQQGDETTKFKPGTRVFAVHSMGDPLEGVVQAVHSNPTRYTVGWLDALGDVFEVDVVDPDLITLPEDWVLNWR